jgi:hypothetical protein
LIVDRGSLYLPEQRLLRLFEAKYSQGLATNEAKDDDGSRVLEILRNRLEEIVPWVFIQYLFK